MESELDLINNRATPSTGNSEEQINDQKKGRISYLLCVIIGVFGIGSWIDISGLWVELPLFVEALPEQWTLPSYLVIIIQVANIGPVLYMLGVWLTKGRLKERYVIYTILSTGTVSCFLLAFLWDTTVLIGSVSRSIPLLVLAFFLAFVDCTSSLTFLPFMASFPSVYMTALYIGEGCSGLVPALAALVQGIGGEVVCVNETKSYPNGTNYTVVVPEHPKPHFGVPVFMSFLTFMLACSLTSFALLDILPRYRLLRLGLQSGGAVKGQTASGTYKSDWGETEIAVTRNNQGNWVASSNYRDNSGARGLSPTQGNDPFYNTFVGPADDLVAITPISQRYRRYKLGVELGVILLVNLLTNGLLPSIQSYSALPYGRLTYHLTVTLTNIANPVACFVTFAFHARHIRVYLGMMLGVVGLAIYLIIVALASPTPPLQHSAWGAFIQVTCWVVLTAVVSFLKASIALELRLEGPSYLRWCGAVTQLGSLFGAIISFLMVSVFFLFKQMPSCP